MNPEIDELRHYLDTLPPGKVEDTNTLDSLLAAAWDHFSGDCGGMEGYKISGRLEDVKWDPPGLSFTIERHGAVMFGSSRAELQDWTVNMDRLIAGYSSRHRQICKQEPPLKTKPLAERIGRLIIERKDSKELKWNDDKTEVRIIAGMVIPDDVAKQTLSGRRKRFRRDLTDFMEKYHWQELRANRYRFCGQEQQTSPQP